jgi:hypothetical protein
MMSRSFTAYQLKWIAIITMTVDHFGVIVLSPYQSLPNVGTLYLIARLIGRIAFPLFAFMIAEGMLKTRHRGRYVLRLFAMALFIGIAMYGLGLFDMRVLAGNIFVDLAFAALTMMLVLEKTWWKKLLCLLPLTYYVYAATTTNLAAYLRPDYGLYGLILMGLFFIMLMILKPQSPTKTNPSMFSTLMQRWQTFGPYQLAGLALVFLHLLWYIIYLVGNALLPMNDAFMIFLGRYVGGQSYAMLAGFFIYYYQGEKGKAPKWFQAFSYLYYPLHFVGLYGLYLLTTILG